MTTRLYIYICVCVYLDLFYTDYGLQHSIYGSTDLRMRNLANTDITKTVITNCSNCPVVHYCA